MDKEALDDLRAALAANPEAQPDLVVEVAQALACGGLADEAVRVLEAGVKRLGPIPSLQLKILEVELNAGRYDSALSRLDAMQRSAPRPEPWMEKRASILAQAVDLASTYSGNLDGMGTAGVTAPAGWTFHAIAGDSGDWTTSVIATGAGGGTANATLIASTTTTVKSSTWTNFPAFNPTITTVPNSVGVTTTAPALVTFSSALANNSTVLFRWVDDNAQTHSPDQILGLDNLSIAVPIGQTPVATLTAPANGSVWYLGDTINLTATASDSDGSVTKVEFYQDAIKLGEDTTNPYEYAWTGFAAGDYSLTARATDNDGNVGTTATWIIAFWHHPPYSKGSHNSDTSSQLVTMRTNFNPILEDGGVDLVFLGHSHNYERSVLLDGHYGTSGTITHAMKKNSGNGSTSGFTTTANGKNPQRRQQFHRHSHHRRHGDLARRRLHQAAHRSTRSFRRGLQHRGHVRSEGRGSHRSQRHVCFL